MAKAKGPKKSDASAAKPKWTVMVFMGADGVEGNVPLAVEAAADIAEMKKVGSEGGLNLLVQLHGDGEPKRFHIGKSEAAVPEYERDLVNGYALSKFVTWALDSGHRDGDYTMLVLWGHAYRFGIGHTDSKVGIDAIDFAELADVLKGLQADRRRPGLDRPKLDIIAFDACDLATV